MCSSRSRRMMSLDVQQELQAYSPGSCSIVVLLWRNGTTATIHSRDFNDRIEAIDPLGIALGTEYQRECSVRKSIQFERPLTTFSCAVDTFSNIAQLVNCSQECSLAGVAGCWPPFFEYYSFGRSVVDVLSATMAIRWASVVILCLAATMASQFWQSVVSISGLHVVHHSSPLSPVPGEVI
jgi:hypothetical protein